MFLFMIYIILLICSENKIFARQCFYKSIPDTVTLQPAKFKHAYHQTLVMKMMNAIPDGKGGSKVFINFEKALKLIKDIDNITLGVPKIIYLTGWQYNGHDDLYPAFFEVNKALKRPQDKDAKESLLWLMREAKQYHTTVSLHINMTDAYNNSMMWKEYVENDLISKNADGSLMEIGFYNNLKSYQINYKNEWEKGFAQKRIDSLLKLLPQLKEAGTIHLDAWISRESKGHNESLSTEREYQMKICRYWLEQGIDPTSEWVMDYMTGLIPYYWHFNHRTQADYLNVPANICTGSHMNPDLRNSDFGLEFLFGTSMYGERRFPSENNKIADNEWEKGFTEDFFLNFPQYYYLNGLKRLQVTGEKKQRVAYFSDDVKVSLADSTVKKNNLTLRDKNTIFFPVAWLKNNSYVIFSTTNQVGRSFGVPAEWKGVKTISVQKVTANGLSDRRVVSLKKGSISTSINGNTPLLLTPVKL